MKSILNDLNLQSNNYEDNESLPSNGKYGRLTNEYFPSFMSMYFSPHTKYVMWWEIMFSLCVYVFILNGSGASWSVLP